jgi:beta-glucanase (GH16 family)
MGGSDLRRFALLSLLALFFLAPATSSAAQTFVFQDEFSGTAGAAPNPNKWHRLNTCNVAPMKDNCFNPKNAYLDGAGNLVLMISRGTMGRPFDGATVATQTNGGWPPGQILASVSPPVHVEARIKFAPGIGVWQGFWFTHSEAGSELELDVQEFRGGVPKILACFVHGVVAWGSQFNWGVNGSAAFHTYWMNYYRDRVVFGVDGTTCGQKALPNISFRETIKFDAQVGKVGTWGGVGRQAGDGNPVVPTFMRVDYVRAWAL